ncbi:hypothetical protein C479_05198 [Halovivax asiaticus JCM 14624]|uniref:DUF7511 domain-containing protein n=1 Tax=Halovivax asiaticus JCM 14624 TaxID=1227490 RepID=M0BNW5_9EURY|nr:hypothetical protein [Halovivax asiaticus]ELZ12177.1 hypothetical protein C479_05198 [Halovivax asiaticus JCM 14624]
MTNLDPSPSDRHLRGAVRRPQLVRSIALEHRIVRYESSPDRCTIFPPACEPAEQLTTWLSADQSAFVDLESAR